MNNNKRQVLIIRGGESFENKEDYFQYLRTVPIDRYKKGRNWRDWIAWALEETHDVLIPLMPCKQNADYEAWKIWFERHFEFLQDEVIIIGHSLGATFLYKYFTENTFPKKILQLHLVGSYITDTDPLYIEKISSFYFDIEKIPVLKNLCDDMHLWHSRDDMVVPFSNSELVSKHLPDAKFHIFENRGHFSQPAFIELLQEIQSKG